MKILLINPATGFFWYPNTNPLGLLSIATYLKVHGHTVEIYDRALKRDDFKKRFDAFKPDIAGISLHSTPDINDAIKLSKELKSRGIPAVWGGILATELAETILESGCVDAVITGEGELAFLALAEAFRDGRPLSETDGIAYMENGRAVFTKTRPFLDLSTLPPLDWTLIQPEKYFQTRFHCRKLLYLYASKGCPGRCTFCFNEQFNKSTCRLRSVAHVLDDMEYLIKNHGMDGVYFTDATWSNAHMRAMCEGILERGLHISWHCQTNIGQQRREDFDLMYRAGCRSVFFGIESGVRERLATIRKGIAYDKISETIDNCIAAGISPIPGFIIGFPGETVEELRGTIEFAKNLRAKVVMFNSFAPLPGSALFDELVANGTYDPPKTLEEWGDVVFADDDAGPFGAATLKELFVIRWYFNMRSATNKDAVEKGKSFEMFFFMLGNAFANVFSHGLRTTVANLAPAARSGLKALWNITAHPGIRKKYGLYKIDREG